MSNPPLSKTDTREHLLDSAQQLVQLASYDGFSFRDLAEQVGIRKASIYHHFPSKEALAIAMLERAKEGIVRWSESKSSLTPVKKLEAYCFDLYIGWLGAGTRLCPAGAFSASWSTLPDNLQQAVRAVFREQRQFLESALADGIADGSISPGKATAVELAEWLLATVQGALVTARTTATVEESGAAIFTRICQQTLRQICRD